MSPHQFLRSSYCLSPTQDAKFAIDDAENDLVTRLKSERTTMLGRYHQPSAMRNLCACLIHTLVPSHVEFVNDEQFTTNFN